MRQFSSEEVKYMQLVDRLFNQNPDGKEFIDGLVKTYIMQPTLPPLEKATMYPDYYGAFREGENAVTRRILAILETYKQYCKEKDNDRSIHIDGNPS